MSDVKSRKGKVSSLPSRNAFNKTVEFRMMVCGFFGTARNLRDI